MFYCLLLLSCLYWKCCNLTRPAWRTHSWYSSYQLRFSMASSRRAHVRMKRPSGRGVRNLAQVRLCQKMDDLQRTWQGLFLLFVVPSRHAAHGCSPVSNTIWAKNNSNIAYVRFHTADFRLNGAPNWWPTGEIHCSLCKGVLGIPCNGENSFTCLKVSCDRLRLGQDSCRTVDWNKIVVVFVVVHR